MTEHDTPTTVWRTTEEVAAQLRISKKLIYRAVRNGELRSVTVGGRGDYRFKQEWVDAWMDAKAVLRRR